MTGRRATVALGFITAATAFAFSQTNHSVELSERVELSDQVQQRIKTKLAHSSEQDVYVFDREGTVKQRFEMNPAAAAPQSLSVLMKSSDSPVKDCKKAVPTPPPGCIVCESGQVVCSKKLQEPRKKDP